MTSVPRRSKSSANKHDSIKEARQKKLQIDGENLLKKINATISNTEIPQDDLTHIANIKLDDDLKKYKYSLEAIELLFLNINENMNEDDVKHKNFKKIQGDILRLETSINNLRDSLKSEMIILKESEEKLCDDDVSPNITDPESESDETVSDNPKRVGSKHEMNPNSVKNIVNCPFKSQEVQQYLNFTKSNKKLGGWNDVYHNVFVQLWNKNIGKIKDFNHDDADIFESSSFMRFTKEIQLRIKGLITEDLIDHSKWYIKYLYFRSRQQLAIDKYKEEKRMKNPPPPVTENNVKAVKAVKSKRKLPPVITSKTNPTTTKVNVINDVDSDWSDEDDFEP